MRFTIKAKPSNRFYERLVEELPERIDAVIEHYPWWMANEFHKQMLLRGPRDIPNYIKKLRLQRFKHPLADHVFGVVLPGYEHSQRLKLDDVKRTVIYIGQRRKTRPDPGVEVLERYNPWTMETLPYEPQQATMTSRKVTEREAALIKEARQADRASQVDQELRNLGIQAGRSHPTLLSRKVSRDIVFEALRREFGAQGESHQSHMRPALLALQRRIEPRLFRTLAMRYLSVPSERRWKKPIRTKIGPPSLPKRVRPLQDLIIGDSTT